MQGTLNSSWRHPPSEEHSRCFRRGQYALEALSSVQDKVEAVDIVDMRQDVMFTGVALRRKNGKEKTGTAA
ncbi:hypothetical protein NDU88_001800 [Pleurodeles waltl]|uniref:Uncharacterized protein n=1 Tax=Pleurodeles waltl TaxID=8319 RepID=A0AAV7M972_PLEWA|nr:hypothetical protein NDU88_001800 [Pleurodeles waltl]